MNVLVTGGAGYIGSHAALRLRELGHRVTIVDNLTRGHAAAVDAIARVSGTQVARVEQGADPTLCFEVLDLLATDDLASLVQRREIGAVLHFAALAYVGESVHEPLRYYRNNVAGSLSLFEAMERSGVARLVFSSTCATYGEPGAKQVPISEECPQEPVNPYGRSKLMVERTLRDLVERADGSRGQTPLQAIALRYFNVAGCDAHGRLGEDHRPETHLIPICLEVALNLRPSLSIFGDDYSTPDGTCVRDYVHVDDLVEAHIVALDAIASHESGSAGAFRAWNVGLGRGQSVLDVVHSCRRVTGHAIPVHIAPRRAGDPPTLFADARRIAQDLGWRPAHVELDDIVETAWRWRRDHPRGYV